MAAISQKINSLIGGVSQQPDTVKFNGQLRRCDNFYPDVAAGLTKRPGLQGIRKLANAVDDGTWFMVFRDDKEKYVLQFSKAGALKIWSANSGLQQTVNAVAAESTTYATHQAPDDLQLLQINDYIFVLNRNQTVSMAATTSAAIIPYGFLAVNTIAVHSTYTVILNGTTVYSYTTPSGSGQLNINDITSNLASVINAGGIWTTAIAGNNIYIRRVDGADFTLESRGGNAGTSIEAFKGSVASAAQLPKQFFQGQKIKVSGSNDTGADDYWVEFKTANNTGSGAGVWEETIAPVTVTTINEETMPHAIIREANGTFTYRKLDLASAIASAGVVPISGIPTAVSIVSANTGGHFINEEFWVSGGTGSNLRLIVTNTGNLVTTNSYAANSGNFVIQQETRLTIGKQNSRFTTYRWYINNNQIGSTRVPSLTIGNQTFTLNGGFQNIANTSRAGVTVTTTTPNVITGVRILQEGQGYAAPTNVVSPSGDVFQITAVTSKFREGDLTRLQYWKPRIVGDATTNPNPSFIGSTIDAISFYKNRLIFTSRQNVICSQAGDYFNFFADTVITILDSDPIDLSASSTKPVRFKSALPGPKGLLVFGDNGQYILETTTEAFSPKTAEINMVAAYSATDRISPIDIGPSYLFLEEGQKASSIYEMDATTSGGGGKPTVIELTRFIPSYIPAAISQFKCSVSSGFLAIHSLEERDSLYIYRWFQNGDQGRVSAWFRWILPGNIETFDFDQDIMYVVTKHGSNYVLSTVALLTDTPSESLLFEGQYIDIKLDLFDYKPLVTYDLATDVTSICFKEGFEDMDLQAVLVFLSPDVAGYFEEQTIQFDNSKPAGQKYFLTKDGNETAAGGACTVDRLAGSTTATITCQFAHKLTTGNTITVLTGVAPGDYVVTVLTDTTFTITTVATTAIVFTRFVFSCVNTASKFALGYKYLASADLPAFYYVRDPSSASKDTLNIPRIHRIHINSYNSGPYKAIIRAEGRDDFELTLPQLASDFSLANKVPIIRNAQSTVPIMAKGTQVDVELIADSPFPTAFTSLDWEGTYNNKGIRSV
jgi:hypothetical protein